MMLVDLTMRPKIGDITEDLNWGFRFVADHPDKGWSELKIVDADSQGCQITLIFDSPAEIHSLILLLERAAKRHDQLEKKSHEEEDE